MMIAGGTDAIPSPYLWDEWFGSWVGQSWVHIHQAWLIGVDVNQSVVITLTLLACKN